MKKFTMLVMLAGAVLCGLLTGCHENVGATPVIERAEYKDASHFVLYGTGSFFDNDLVRDRLTIYNGSLPADEDGRYHGRGDYSVTGVSSTYWTERWNGIKFDVEVDGEFPEGAEIWLCGKWNEIQGEAHFTAQ